MSIIDLTSMGEPQSDIKKELNPQYPSGSDPRHGFAFYGLAFYDVIFIRYTFKTVSPEAVF